jgi:hypothetical protein
MNGSARVSVLNAVVLPALLLVASAGALLAQQEEKTIVGAWLFSNDATPNSKVVVVYHRDGTFIHFAGGLTADGSYQHPAGGVWRNGTGRSYVATGIYTNYMPGTSTMLYMLKASATWTVSQDGDHFSGPFRVEVISPDGTVIATRTGTSSATRIAVEPIP